MQCTCASCRCDADMTSLQRHNDAITDNTEALWQVQMQTHTCHSHCSISAYVHIAFCKPVAVNDVKSVQHLSNPFLSCLPPIFLFPSIPALLLTLFPSLLASVVVLVESPSPRGPIYKSMFLFLTLDHKVFENCQRLLILQIIRELTILIC